MTRVDPRRFTSNRCVTDAPTHAEHGAVLVFVAIGLVALIGFMAFAVDFGRIYNERRQLQSGADAAALAIAADCAGGDCGDYAANAELYADANAGDGAAWVRELGLDLGAAKVRVGTATEAPGGGNVFDTLFAPVFGFDGLTVGADATVAWGSPRSLTSLPLTFSQCEWQAFGGSAVSVDSLPPAVAGYAAAGSPITIYFHGTHPDCHESSSGQDLPGGFGWLAAGGQCRVDINVGAWLLVDTGNSPSNGCNSSQLASAVGTIVLLPYFDRTTGTGSGGKYRIEGFGAFYLTGYYVGGGGWTRNSIVTGNPPCTGSDRCIQGYVVGDYVSSDDDGALGGIDRGVTIIKFVG
jgi:Flp pilus assembly protein TadG